jgi:hypothetical protein
MKRAVFGAAGLLVLATSLSFGQSAPMTIALSGNAALVTATSFSIIGNGSISSLGNAVLSGAGTLSQATLSGVNTGPISGSFTLIFPSGAVLVGTFSIPAGVLIPQIGGSSSGAGSITITGGTGSLAGATGSFTLNGSGTATGGTTSTISLSGNGTLTTPSSPGTVQQVLPQFVFGGGWYTALYFSNTSSSPVSFPVSFTADNGTPLIVPTVQGSSTTVSLAAGGTAIIEALNSGPLTEGYVSVTLPGGVVGYGVFRQSVPGIADQEAVVPFSPVSATSAIFTFDDTSYVTSFAIVNPSNVANTATVTVRNSSGTVLGTSSIALPAQNKTEKELRALAGLGTLAGARGSVQFTVTTGNVAVLGLRFNGVAFTSIPTVEQ